MTNIKGISLLLLSALMFASYGIWSRLMGDTFDNFYQGWTRGLIIAVLLLPILIYKKMIVPIKKKDRNWFIVFLCFTSLTQAPLYYAYNHMDIGTATILFFGTMLLTMYIFGFLFLKEKLSRVKIIAFMVACAGLLSSISFSLTKFSFLAAFVAMFNGVASGGEGAFSKKISDNYSTLYITWFTWSIIFVTNLALSLLLKETQHLPSLSMVWVYQMGYVITGIVGFWALIEGLKSIEASTGGLISLLEIIFTISFGVILFAEKVTLTSSIGALLVLTAAALPNLHEIYSHKRS